MNAYAIERGTVTAVNHGQGTVQVRTSSGVLLRQCIWGVGSTQPTPRSRVVVAWFNNGVSKEAYILSRYEAPPTVGASDGTQMQNQGSIPGDQRFPLANGGSVLFSPSGLISLEAHPMAHLRLIPRDRLAKEFYQNWERISGPLNQILHRVDVDKKAAIYEEMFNETYVFRTTDDTPSYYRRLGVDQTLASAGLPRSPFLFLEEAHARTLSSSEPIATHTTEMGFVGGVVRSRKIFVVSSEIKQTVREGQFDEIVYERDIVGPGDEPLFNIKIMQDGTLTLVNPTWGLTLLPNNSAVLENDNTRIEIVGEQITIGANGVVEKMVMGGQLKAMLTSMISMFNTHVHPGSGVPPLVPWTSLQATYLTNDAILSNKNKVSKGNP